MPIYPSADEIRSLFDFDYELGVLRWKPRLETSGVIKHWNRRYAGKIAGSLDTANGYINVLIHKKKFPLHRIIWIYVNGCTDAECIDHINGNPTDNRISNLREASKAENSRNRSKRKTKGYYLHKKSGLWHVRIGVGNKKIHIGYYSVEDQARVAASKAKDLHHGEFSGY